MLTVNKCVFLTIFQSFKLAITNEIMKATSNIICLLCQNLVSIIVLVEELYGAKDEWIHMGYSEKFWYNKEWLGQG